MLWNVVVLSVIATHNFNILHQKIAILLWAILNGSQNFYVYEWPLLIFNKDKNLFVRISVRILNMVMNICSFNLKMENLRRKFFILTVCNPIYAHVTHAKITYFSSNSGKYLLRFTEADDQGPYYWSRLEHKHNK